MGWLSASPESKNPKAKRKPRRAGFAKRGCSMNPADWGVDVSKSGFILGAVTELGWAGSNGMGPTTLSWSEIKAYGELTGQNLAPWEARTLRNISEAYVYGYQSDNNLDPARWDRYMGALIPFIPLTEETVTLRPELEASYD